MDSLAYHLLGQTRSAVLSVLLLRPEASLHVREIARRTGAHVGSLHRELRVLAELGVLVRRKVGRQVHYQANVECPIYPELAGLLRKTAGVADVLRDALASLTGRIEEAFVYGSMATGNTHADSDVDVMIVGDVGFADAVLAFDKAQQTIGREVNPTVMTRTEFTQRCQQKDGFVSRVLRGPTLPLIGHPHELG